MNIYEKLQKARMLLQNIRIKKSGKNPFAKYEYFELSDFLPAINKIMDDIKITTNLKIINNKAILIIINSETPIEKLTFSIPFDIPKLEGTNTIQNIGAGITYIRRYLLMVAFEIVENDIIDSQPLQKTEDVKKDDIETLYQSFLSLEKVKNIPDDKKENIEKVKTFYKENKLKTQTLKNAIEFLNSLEDKKVMKEKQMKFEKLQDSDLMIAFEEK